MLITPDRYEDSLKSKFKKLLNDRDVSEEELDKTIASLQRFVKEEVNQKLVGIRIEDNKKYPFAYNYMEWIKKTGPVNKELIEYMPKIYGNRPVNLTDIYPVFYKLMENRFPYLTDLALDFIWQEGKMPIEFLCNFNITKQIYDFDKDCLDYLMSDTDISKIPYQVLAKNLPLNAFAINNTFDIGDKTVCQTFIARNYDHEGKLQLGILFITEKPDCDYIYLHLPLEDDKADYDEDIMNKIKAELTEVAAFTIKALYKIMPCIVYLCAANKEIRPLKERNGLEKNRDKYRQKVELKCDDVGFYLGSQIKKNRVRYVGSSSGFTGTGSSKRPHLRSGHFHHYWTGQGRTELTVKFVESTFVHGNVDKVVMHKVKK